MSNGRFASPATAKRSLGRRLAQLALCASVLMAAGRAHGEVRVGDAFPALASVETSAGDLPALEGKVALVDFWASWCAPCKSSFPAFARLHQEFAGRGLVIVAISVDEKPAAFADFVKKQQPPFATIRDDRHRLAELLKVPAMPTSYLIGRNGRVRFIHAGFHGAATERELRAQIETLLAETPGAKS